MIAPTIKVNFNMFLKTVELYESMAKSRIDFYKKQDSSFGFSRKIDKEEFINHYAHNRYNQDVIIPFQTDNIFFVIYNRKGPLVESMDFFCRITGGLISAPIHWQT